MSAKLKKGAKKAIQKNRYASPYKIGSIFREKYIGSTLKEILSPENQRLGWIWTMSDGTVIVSPHLGLYVWYGEGGESWTLES